MTDDVVEATPGRVHVQNVGVHQADVFESGLICQSACLVDL